MRLDELLDAARADEGAVARTRARWLARQAEESATMLGLLLDLAEHGHGVSLTCAGGRRVDGTIRALGADVALVDDVAVQVAAIAVVRTPPGVRVGAATGARVPALDLTFGELLARLVDDRPEIGLSLVTGDSASGVLVAVGDDVLTVRLAAGDGGMAYVSLASVASARLG